MHFIWLTCIEYYADEYNCMFCDSPDLVDLVRFELMRPLTMFISHDGGNE